MTATNAGNLADRYTRNDIRYDTHAMTATNAGNLADRSGQLHSLYAEAEAILSQTGQIRSDLYTECFKMSSEIILFLDTLNPLQLQSDKNSKIAKGVYYTSAEILVRSVGLGNPKPTLEDNERNNLFVALAHLKKCITIEPLSPKFKELFKIVVIYLCNKSFNFKENIQMLNHLLFVEACDPQIHLTIGFNYQNDNDFDNAIKHFKMALGLVELLEVQEGIVEDRKKLLLTFKLRCLSAIGNIYYSLQDRDTSLYYQKIAFTLDSRDPNINNQLGVLYTELRIVDKAVYHYNRGIEFVDNLKLSDDRDQVLASLNMNMGLAECYNCNFVKAIACYDKALKYKPRLSLAYQNKLLDSNYISHLITDQFYISKMHKRLGKIYPKVHSDWKTTCPGYTVNQDVCLSSRLNEFKALGAGKRKLRIGFVSGDFICHPVSYFTNCIFDLIDYDSFDVFTYSVKVINLHDMLPKCTCRIAKGKGPEDLKKMIQDDKIDILFDLSGHTGDNRLDTFVLKPAPIQITYCGYPNTTGLKCMDYRITDHVADNIELASKYYSEKLLFMPHSFLCYTPGTGKDLSLVPDVTEPPHVKNGYVTFGTFNRLNKVNQRVINTWKDILIKSGTCRLVIKTKEFLTDSIREAFFANFDPDTTKRIEVLGYSNTYLDHLPDYNKIDLCLDTFPYAGTTTSCEALLMGVPIITLFDNVKYYHSQNVTSSLLRASGLPEYIAESQDSYVDLALKLSRELSDTPNCNLKSDTRNKFYTGHVCNYQEFVTDFENLLFDTYRDHHKA